MQDMTGMVTCVDEAVCRCLYEAPSSSSGTPGHKGVRVLMDNLRV